MNTKTKKIISSLLIAANMAIPANITLAKEESMTHQEVKVYFNNEKIEFDQEPIVVDGRTKVPFRAIFESMGTIVYYRDSDSSVLGITRDGDTIYHKVGTNKATINGVEKTYDSVSEMRNYRTLVPVRMVADLLRADVEWVEKTKTVEIEKEIETSTYHKLVRGILGCAVDQNFNPEDFDRYLNYQRKNTNMDPKQVVIDVNMDLDLELVEEQRWINGEYHTYLVPKEEDVQISYNVNSPLILINRFNILPPEYKDTIQDEDMMPIFWITQNNKYNDLMRFSFLKNGVSQKYVEMATAAETAGCNVHTLNSVLNQNEVRDELDSYSWRLRKYLEQVTDDTYLLNSWWINQYNSERHTGYLVGVAKDYDPKYFAIKILLLNDRLDLAKQTSIYLDYYEKRNEANGPVYNHFIGYEDEMKTYAWLEQHCHEYGFIQRFPKGKEHITRYCYMPWYYKYVGEDVAKIIKDNNWCFEEYYARYLNPTEYKTDLESTKKKVLEKY